jgi:hypothetical protein
LYVDSFSSQVYHHSEKQVLMSGLSRSRTL